MTTIRLQKAIADAGYCSRRRAEGLIGMGKVKVNGEVAKLGSKIDPEEDEIKIENKKLKIDDKKDFVYIILNKPVGYITSASSEQGKSVLDLIDSKYTSRRLYPVGRLDKDSDGLVLLTNDGELANELIHPRYEHEKEYEVLIDNRLAEEHKQKLKRPMKIGAEIARGLKIKKIKSHGKQRIITVILKEGKNRQIRRMFGQLGYAVLSLKRTRLGKLELGTLPCGKWKFVEKKEIV